MARKNDRRSGNRIEPNWGANQQAESYGPQGNALILELQRLRQAFDSEGQDPRAGSQRRFARDGGGRNRRPPSRKSRRKKKGTMERAIDMCLRPFGLRQAYPREDLNSGIQVFVLGGREIVFIEVDFRYSHVVDPCNKP